jgi:8-oxo-dGTP pyrophosphatase MutT (NUDIX family)
MPDLFLVADGDPRLESTSDLAVARLSVEAAASATSDARIAILAFVATHEDALHRECEDGHLTGSAFVVDAEASHTLLLHHRKLDRWLQPGGHADGNANLAAVALREATEETGIDGLRIAVPAIDVDVHFVDPPGEEPHFHFDVRHLVVAPPDAEVRLNDESYGHVWASWAELSELSTDDGLLRLVDCGFELARELLAEGAA